MVGFQDSSLNFAATSTRRHGQIYPRRHKPCSNQANSGCEGGLPTDIFKAKEILGDHICLAGDVPAALLVFGSPEEVYEYSRKLITELGPEGFMLQSGCDIPANAKLENVRAMVAAAMEK